jgi:hypothetical protein
MVLVGGGSRDISNCSQVYFYVFRKVRWMPKEG